MKNILPRKPFFWICLVAGMMEIMADMTELVNDVRMKIDDINDFNNLFNDIKGVDFLNTTQAEDNIQDFKVSGDFTATLESITDMKIDIDIFSKIKTTGKEFTDVIKRQTKIPTKDFSIAVDQLGDGGRDFTTEVMKKIVVLSILFLIIL